MPARRLAGLTLALALLSSQAVFATGSTWTGGGTDGTWSNTSNWNGGTIPGVADNGVTTTNADTATFTTTTGSHLPVVIDAGGRNIGGITFNGSGVFTIGSTSGPSILLSSGGTIQAAAGTTAIETINAPIVLENASGGNSGTATFTSAISGSNVGLSIGAVTGMATTGNTSTLTLGSSASGNDSVNGVVGDGSAGGKLAITMTATSGVWNLTGNNTFSGGVTLNGTGGTIDVGSNTALGTGTVTWTTGDLNPTNGARTISNAINLTAGTLGGQASENTANSLALSGTFTFMSSGGSRTLTQTKLANASITGPVYLSDSSSAGGQATITMNTATDTLTISGNIAPSVVAGTTTGRLTKTGAGLLVLSGNNTYSGGTILSSGPLAVGSNSALGSGGLTMSTGATIESADSTAHSLSNAFVNGTGAAGGTYNFGATSVETGNLTFTNTAAFGLGTGTGTDTFAVNNTTTLDMGLSGASSGLAKSGNGTLVLASTTGSTYTGGTAVNAGTLLVSNTSNSGVGSGALTVARGAGFGGSGLATVSRFDIGTTGSGTAAIQVGNGVDATSKLTVNGTTSTVTPNNIENANLTFNLDTASTNSNELAVGNSTINFSNVTLTLNLLNNQVIAPFTPYVLIAGTGTNQYSGITVNPVTNQITGLNLVFANAGGYQNSYLFLNTAGGVDDIEVEVVPEPGAWALMLGGLAALVFLQRRRGWGRPEGL